MVCALRGLAEFVNVSCRKGTASSHPSSVRGGLYNLDHD